MFSLLFKSLKANQPISFFHEYLKWDFHRISAWKDLKNNFTCLSNNGMAEREWKQKNKLDASLMFIQSNSRRVVYGVAEEMKEIPQVFFFKVYFKQIVLVYYYSRVVVSCYMMHFFLCTFCAIQRILFQKERKSLLLWSWSVDFALLCGRALLTGESLSASLSRTHHLVSSLAEWPQTWS